MSLGGLIPIGGGGGGGGAKKPNDLTSGLISISAPKSGGRTGGDLDMSDFDVDDLLSDTAGGARTKSKAGTSPTSKDRSSKSKKSGSSSSKSKDKDKASSSTKKKSKKKKTSSVLDDSADNDDLDEDSNSWRGGSSKSKPATTSKWSLDDDSTEFDAVPVKKKGNLDAEFAKMLGLDDEFGVGTEDNLIGTATRAEDGEGDSVASSGARGGGGKSELLSSSSKVDNDESGVSSFSYEPRVRVGGGKGKDTAGASSIFDDVGDGGGSAKSYSDPFAARTEAARKGSGGGHDGGDERETAGDAVEGLSASFFQDESSGARKDGDADDPFGGSSLSFLSSASERRGGRGGGRRGGGISAPMAEDPFASVGSRRSESMSDPFGAKGDIEKKASTLDSLFGSSRERKEAGGDDGDRFSGSKKQSETYTADRAEATSGAASTGGRRQSQRRTNDGDLFAELFPSESSSFLKADTAKAPVETSPERDLVAELFPSEPSSSRTSKPTKTERSESELSRSSPTFGKDTKSAKDDLLADLMPPKSTRPSPTLDKDSRSVKDELLADLLPSKATIAPPTSVKDSRSAKDDLLAELLPSKPAKSSPTLDKDSRSAKDDLLAELSPAKPSKPSPIRERAARSAKDDLLTELTPPKSAKSSPTRNYEARDAKDDLLAELLPSETPKAQAELPSGIAKTLGSLSVSSIKEVDFEQSKDSLLEELLSPSKSPPPSPFRRGSSSRRNSYSQSFENEGDVPIPDSPRRRRRSPSVVPSPSQSPDKARIDTQVYELSLAQERINAAERRQESDEHLTPSAAPSPLMKTSQLPTHAAASEDRKALEISKELLEESLRKREDELRVESEAAKAVLIEAHSNEVARLNIAILELKKQLSDMQTKHQALVGESMQSQTQVSLLEQEKMVLMQQIASLQTEKHQLQQDLHAVRAQHAVCETQSTLFQSERAGFLSQVKSLEDQNRQLVLQVNQEKQEHQATQLKFASFQQEKEQEASLQKQKESHHMTKLFQQLQTSLVSLKMLQEQVVGEEITKHEVENESRLRMITSLETSSRKCAKQTEEECFRLASLLSNLETTLRHYRQEHLEEKERLRQEQLRLNVLASHFQAQTSVMHEKADANTQMLAQYFTTSMQDVRVAESRLAVRRQNLEDEEKQLYDERTRFAVYREEFLQQQAREVQKMQTERLQLDKKWKELQLERADLDDVIASHEDEFQYLQAEKRALEDERQSVEFHARQVADMAKKFEAFTQQMLAREDEIASEKQEIDKWKLEFSAKKQDMASEKQKLDERELRLHHQLKQMEKARQRLNSQRKEFLSANTAGVSRSSPSLNPLAVHDLDQAKRRLLEHTRYMGARGIRDVTAASASATAPVDNNRKWRAPEIDSFVSNNQVAENPLQHPSVSSSSTTAAVPPHARTSATTAFTLDLEPPIWNDPSGLSPGFRQLVEDNWKKHEWNLGVADAALHKERMWISCLGLDTSTPANNTQAGDRRLQNQQQQQRNAGVKLFGTSATLSSAASVPKSVNATTSAPRQPFAMPTSQQRMPPPPSSSTIPSTLPSRRAVTIDL